MRQSVVNPHFSFSPRAANNSKHEPHNNAAEDALAGRANEGSTTPARVDDESTPDSTDSLDQDIMRVIRRMILTGEIPEP